MRPPTSAEAYRHLVESGALTTRQVDVYEVLFTNRRRYEQGMTAREINEHLIHFGRGHSGVHSRLRELKEIGLVSDVDKDSCSITGRMAMRWVCNGVKD